VTRVRAFGNVHQLRLVDAVRRPALENETPVAITAIDIAVLVDLEIDLGMAERRGTVVLAGADIGRAIAPHAPGGDLGDFGRRQAHGRGPIMGAMPLRKDSQLVALQLAP